MNSSSHVGRAGHRFRDLRRDAHRAGFDTAEQARKALRRTDDPVFRIGLRHAGPDPRIALRNDAALSAADLADLRTRLDRSIPAHRTARGREKY